MVQKYKSTDENDEKGYARKYLSWRPKDNYNLIGLSNFSL